MCLCIFYVILNLALISITCLFIYFISYVYDILVILVYSMCCLMFGGRSKYYQFNCNRFRNTQHRVILRNTMLYTYYEKHVLGTIVPHWTFCNAKASEETYYFEEKWQYPTELSCFMYVKLYNSQSIYTWDIRDK